jgi:hypothetical protein
MCGKANPADAEVCAYCSARLKPLNLSSSGSDSGVPDWLRDLRGKDSEQPPAASPFGEGSLSESDEKPAGPFGGESGGH